MSNRGLVGLMSCALALCAWCGWVSGFHRTTAPAVATWAISLTAIASVNVMFWRGSHGRQPGWRLRPADDPWPRANQLGRLSVLVGISPWLGLVLVIVVWEILGIDTGSSEPHLTISALAQAFRLLNAALLLVWMLAGLGYGVARAKAPVASRAGENDPGAAGGSVLMGGCLTGTHLPTVALGLLLPANRAVGVGFWLGVVVVGVAIDLLARHSGGHLANAGELLRLVTSSMAGRFVLIAAWTFAGWHLFAY